MPLSLEKCVKQVKADIASGKLPKGSNAWAVCKAALAKSKTKVNGGKGGETSPVADYVRGRK